MVVMLLLSPVLMSHLSATFSIEYTCIKNLDFNSCWKRYNLHSGLSNGLYKQASVVPNSLRKHAPNIMSFENTTFFNISKI